MEKCLRWCAGKFVYLRGSTQTLHFMELKEFAIDDALDYSQLFFLRMLRTRLRDSAFRDEELSRWMDDTAVKLVGDVAAELLHVQEREKHDPVTVAEFYPGVGPTFEYLKLLLEKRGGRMPPFSYRACGPESLRLKFQVLHADEPYPAHYIVDHDLEAGNPGQEGSRMNLTIFNHNNSVRQREEPAVTLDTFLSRVKGPVLIAARAKENDGDEVQTTIKGRALPVPSLGRLWELWRQSGLFWAFRFLKGFDKDFFLPNGEGRLGLLLAYATPTPLLLRGFEPIPLSQS